MWSNLVKSIFQLPVRIPNSPICTHFTFGTFLPRFIKRRKIKHPNVFFPRPKLGDFDTELFREWFQAFAQAAGLTVHIENFYGENNHHIIESSFKALARALRQAVTIDPRAADSVPSTKGTLSDHK